MKILKVNLSPNLPLVAVFKMARSFCCVLVFNKGKVLLARINNHLTS